MTKPTLYLVDGSGFIFRAFHALPPLTRRDGTPVNAVLGFVNMLIKLLIDKKAHRMVVVFDAGRITFRQSLYPAYKANRSETPPELIPQFPLIRQACAAFHVPAVEQDGFEADDIIATLAQRGASEGHKVMIVSSDKDLMQLVTDDIQLFDPMKNITLGRDEVLAKFGVPPESVIDVQALMGDSSDNIPGVPGIGPKTAAELIQQFGSLDAVLARHHEIPQAGRRQRLADHQEQARLSKQLVTLVTDVPLSITLDDLRLQPPDPVVLQHFLDEQNFGSIKRRLEHWLPSHSDHLRLAAAGDAAKSPAQAEGPKGQQFDFFGASDPATPSSTEAPDTSSQSPYTLIQDEATLIRWVDTARTHGTVALDLETNDLKIERADLIGISLALAGEAAYIPIGHRSSEDQSLLPSQVPLATVLKHIRPLAADPSVRKVGHNIKFDMGVLLRHAVEVTPYDDTMVMSYVLHNATHGHGLDELAARYLGHTTMTFKEVLVSESGRPAHKDFSTVALDRACFYAAEDAHVTLQLYQVFRPLVLRSGMVELYDRIERPLCRVIAQMEHFGILIDANALRQLSFMFAERLAELEVHIHALAGQSFNIASPKQLGEILFDHLKLPGGKKGKTGAYGTSADVLDTLANQGHALPARVLEWRQLAKLKSTYADALVEQMHPATHRVHTSFALAITSTGRLSSSEPNLQNIPIRTEEGRKIRAAFMAMPGHQLLSCDYSQIELRLLAHVAEVPSLCEAFRLGRDIHALTAAQVFGLPSVEAVSDDLRRKAKAINFGIIYGISAFGLGRQLDISPGEASAYIESYKQQYPGIVDFMEQTKASAHANGYVTTPWGRRCVINGLNDRSATVRNFAERQAINAPLQGGAADIIKKAMLAADRLIREQFPSVRMVLQVHDELVFEVPAALVASFRPVLTRVMEQVVQLRVPLIVDSRVSTHWA